MDGGSKMGDNSEHSPDTPRSGGPGTRVSAAAHPVGASTIHTDAEGLETGEITASSEGFDVPVYFAKSLVGNGPFPALLVVSEAFGVHAHIADVCRRFAKAGYLALAPDLFARLGDASSFQSLADLIRDVVSKTPDSQVIADLDAVQSLACKLGERHNRNAL